MHNRIALVPMNILKTASVNLPMPHHNYPYLGHILNESALIRFFSVRYFLYIHNVYWFLEDAVCIRLKTFLCRLSVHQAVHIPLHYFFHMQTIQNIFLLLFHARYIVSPSDRHTLHLSYIYILSCSHIDLLLLLYANWTSTAFFPQHTYSSKAYPRNTFSVRFSHIRSTNHLYHLDTALSFQIRSSFSLRIRICSSDRFLLFWYM